MTLIHGDCVAEMRKLPEASVDAVVCDPPYGISFMGKAWDGAAIAASVAADYADGIDRDHTKSRGRAAAMHAGEYDLSPSANQAFQQWCETWAAEAFRVLKPGGHLLAFGGSRTYHRLAAGVEDAGFEIRDQLQWLYGSGFPKSLDVSKAIDKAAGAEGTFGEPKSAAHAGWIERGRMRGADGGEGYEGYQRPWMADAEAVDQNARKYLPATPEAEQWQGWGTALKPAHEPIVLARKPLVGTVARNVLEHGTGALNIDATRIETTDRWEASGVQSDKSIALSGGADGSLNVSVSSTHDGGRWPANVILDDEAGAILDAQTGERAAGNHPANRAGIGYMSSAQGTTGERVPLASGGASRFFYCAKTSKRERNEGLGGMGRQLAGLPGENRHPTVKPVELMRWLLRLVTPPGGTVLDPFVGSGSTGIAAALEGFEFIGIDQDADYLAIAEGRILAFESHR